MMLGELGPKVGSGVLKSSKTFLKLVGILIRVINGWRGALGKAEDLHVTYDF